MFRSELIIDTDIGTDVDDAIALFQIIGSEPETEVALTTNYGDVKKRACIANNYLNLLGASAPIYLGAETTISGREVWESGLEGTLHKDLPDDKIKSISALNYMVNTAMNSETQAEVLAISPCTNIAHFVDAFGDATMLISDVFMMAGRFAEGKPEHNIVSDVLAAQKVFQSELRMTVVGIEITSMLKMSVSEFEMLNNLGPAARLLLAEIAQWSGYWNRDWIVPHDSIAYLIKSNPELFQFSEWGDIQVMDNGQTSFKENPSGTKRIVKDMDVERARSLIISSIQGVKFSS